jgi:protocatechuate 3,4-dioxygenase alpha subunit
MSSDRFAVATSSQTIGPYWHLIEDRSWADLTRFGAEGERVTLVGRVLDGDGAPFPEVCVELWQASPQASDRFSGFGRAATDKNGEYRFVTLKPGPLPGRGNTQQAPHFALTILGRGLMHHLVTRAYFQGEALNETDPLLMSIEDAKRRATLIARPEGAATWRLDIRLQGHLHGPDIETVFLDI